MDMLIRSKTEFSSEGVFIDASCMTADVASGTLMTEQIIIGECQLISQLTYTSQLRPYWPILILSGYKNAYLVKMINLILSDDRLYIFSLLDKKEVTLPILSTKLSNFLCCVLN